MKRRVRDESGRKRSWWRVQSSENDTEVQASPSTDCQLSLNLIKKKTPNVLYDYLRHQEYLDKHQATTTATPTTMTPRPATNTGRLNDLCHISASP